VPPRMALTSVSLFLLPVMKLRVLGAMVTDSLSFPRDLKIVSKTGRVDVRSEIFYKIREVYQSEYTRSVYVAGRKVRL
jgi:hypothetical protein